MIAAAIKVVIFWIFIEMMVVHRVLTCWPSTYNFVDKEPELFSDLSNHYTGILRILLYVYNLTALVIV